MIIQEKSNSNINQFQNLPSQQRQCRDTLCCFLFIINIAAMIYCVSYGFIYGNLNNISRGTDFKTNVCNSTIGFPYLYFYDPFNNSVTNRVCVKECPTYYNGMVKPLTCYGVDCKYQYIASLYGYNITGYTGSLDGIVVGYQSFSIADRICFPSVSAVQILNNQSKGSIVYFFYKNFAQSYVLGFISDITHNWPVLIGAFATSIFISALFLFFLTIFANYILFIFIIGTLICLISFGFFFYYSSGSIGGQVIYMGYKIFTSQTNSQFLANLSYALWTFAGFLLLILIIFYNRIKLTSAVCKCTTKFVTQVGSILLVPIFMTLINIMMWVICLFGLVYLITSAKYISNGSVLTIISSYKDISLLKFYYLIFGTLWCNAIMQAITKFIVSSVCCMWYYSHGPSEEIKFPITKSCRRAIRYHCGSFALGSIILPFVKFFELCIYILKKDIQQYESDQNECISNFIRCLRYFINGLQKIIVCANRSAYVHIALTGNNFFISSKIGFELVQYNISRYSIIGGLGNILMFFGKIIIASGTTVVAFVFIQLGGTSYNFMQPLLSLVVIFIYSYSIGIIFMTVYSIGMDSLVICFLKDEVFQKQNGKKIGQFLPEQLKEIIDNQ